MRRLYYEGPGRVLGYVEVGLASQEDYTLAIGELLGIQQRGSGIQVHLGAIGKGDGRSLAILGYQIPGVLQRRFGIGPASDGIYCKGGNSQRCGNCECGSQNAEEVSLLLG